MALLQIDLRNAFNCVCREVIFQQVRRFVSELYQRAKWSLCARSLLVYKQDALRSERGLHQRSPLGPLLFPLALLGTSTMAPFMEIFFDIGSRTSSNGIAKYWVGTQRSQVGDRIKRTEGPLATVTYVNLNDSKQGCKSLGGAHGWPRICASCSEGIS